jgi:1-acyl-sn-glycerol-3-phosphate acyltransferase
MSGHPTRRSRSSEKRTPRTVRVYRLLRLCLHLIQGCLYVGVVFPFLTSKRRFRAIRAWSRKLLRILHVRYTLHGHLPTLTPILIVSNHVSWLDIWVIDAVVAVRFVAKSDIRRWPVIGFLVKGVGTIFIERDKRRDTAVVALRYVHRTGELNNDASYAGDRSLLESTRLILRQPSIHAEVIFAGEVSVSGKTRREIAIEAERTTARALGLAPPHRKPGTAGGHPTAEPKAAGPTDNRYPGPPHRAA